MRNLGIYLAGLELLVIGGGFIAYSEGWCFSWQVPRPLPSDGKYLTYFGHGAVWGMFLLGNPVAAYILDKYSSQWAAPTGFIVFVAMTMVGVGLLIAWAQDPVPSAMARDGYPTIPGVLNDWSMVILFSVAFMYYACTPTVNQDDIWPITALLMANLACSVLAPPLAVHGKVHMLALGQFAGGSDLLLVAF